MDQFVYLPIKFYSDNTGEIKWKKTSSINAVLDYKYTLNAFKKSNRAVLCGKVSDVIIIDVGNNEIKWDTLLSKNENISTLICQTLSRRHYYFKYSDVIHKKLKHTINKNIGGHDINIWYNNHLVICPPSTGTTYINNNKITKMPEWLEYFVIRESGNVKITDIICDDDI